jgi:transcriptional repressor NrdR
MRCPKCGFQEDKVIDSRASREGNAIRRRRECLSCQHRFTTYEQIDKPTRLMVLKRDGRHEEFTREKLLSGIHRACQKRPVATEEIEELVDQVYNEVINTYDREVNYREVGERVMNGLRGLDKVAYIRFASVYRRFEEADEFVHEVKKLERPHDTLTIRLPGV